MKKTINSGQFGFRPFLVLLALLSLAVVIPFAGAASTAICRQNISNPVFPQYVACPTDQAVFPAASCGDNVLDSGEQCDDGANISGDGCSALCTIESDGFIVANDDLYVFNATTLKAAKIGHITISASLEGKQENPWVAIFFQTGPMVGGIALDGAGNLFGVTSNGSLVLINTATAIATTAQSIGGNIVLSTGLAFGPNNSFYWADDKDGPNLNDDQVKSFKVGAAPGPATTQTALEISALSFDNKQQMFAMSNDSLYKITPLPGGTSTSTIAFGNMGNSIEAMDFAANGEVFAFDSTNTFIKVNLMTNSRAVVGTLSGIDAGAQITGLALVGGCGDLVVDTYLLEECDDGNTADGDGCSSSCDITTVEGNDVLEVKIAGISNQTSKITAGFLQSDSVKMVVTVTNKLGFKVENQPLELKIISVSGGLVHDFGTQNATFNPGANEFETGLFNWSGKPEGAYILKAGVPVQQGEESFALNNDDSKFVNLGPPKPVLNVPEADLGLVPLVALIVAAIAFFSGRTK